MILVGLHSVDSFCLWFYFEEFGRGICYHEGHELLYMVRWATLDLSVAWIRSFSFSSGILLELVIQNSNLCSSTTGFLPGTAIYVISKYRLSLSDFAILPPAESLTHLTWTRWLLVFGSTMTYVSSLSLHGKPVTVDDNSPAVSQLRHEPFCTESQLTVCKWQPNSEPSLFYRDSSLSSLPTERALRWPETNAGLLNDPRICVCWL